MPYSSSARVRHPHSFGVQMVDIHNHVLPRVDDGSPSLIDSVVALRDLSQSGVTASVFTPHVTASVVASAEEFAAWKNGVRRAWDSLLPMIDGVVHDVALIIGAEVMLDIPEPDLRDPWLRIGGGPFVLVEFPTRNIPPASDAVLRWISEQGYRPLLAHPERYPELQSDPARYCGRWREAGAAFAVDAGSLTGHFGARAMAAAGWLLAEGVVDVVGSDYHARPLRVPLAMGAAFSRVVEWAGSDVARLLFETNPGRIVQGEPIEPALPFDVPGPLDRWLRARRWPSGTASVSSS
jgi:protein-tyrosine phosphatase